MRTETAKSGEKETTTSIDHHVAIDRACSRAAMDAAFCEDEEVRGMLLEHLRKLLDIELNFVTHVVVIEDTTKH